MLIAAAVIGVIAFNSNSDKVVVCLDAGHGGDDVGAEGAGRFEKDDNLLLAQKVQKSLQGRNVKVVMTRTDDTFISLEDRCSFSNRKNADLFVALHRNSADAGNGVEIWVDNAKNKNDILLAENIMSALDNVGVSKNRGVRYGTGGSASSNYYVNEHTDMPSCLVEVGFITDDKDNELFDDNIDEYADAIADAIVLSLEETGAITTNLQ